MFFLLLWSVFHNFFSGVGFITYQLGKVFRANNDLIGTFLNLGIQKKVELSNIIWEGCTNPFLGIKKFLFLPLLLVLSKYLNLKERVSEHLWCKHTLSFKIFVFDWFMWLNFTSEWWRREVGAERRKLGELSPFFTFFNFFLQSILSPFFNYLSLIFPSYNHIWPFFISFFLFFSTPFISVQSSFCMFLLQFYCIALDFVWLDLENMGFPPLAITYFPPAMNFT